MTRPARIHILLFLLSLVPATALAQPTHTTHATHTTYNGGVPSSSRRELAIAVLAVLAMALHLTLIPDWPLYAALALGGLPLVVDLGRGLLRGNFSSDLLAGISIVTSVILGEYLAGTLVVLMLSGGQALESYAVRRASSALSALA